MLSVLCLVRAERKPTATAIAVDTEASCTAIIVCSCGRTECNTLRATALVATLDHAPFTRGGGSTGEQVLTTGSHSALGTGFRTHSRPTVEPTAFYSGLPCDEIYCLAASVDLRHLVAAPSRPKMSGLRLSAYSGMAQKEHSAFPQNTICCCWLRSSN